MLAGCRAAAIICTLTSLLAVASAYGQNFAVVAQRIVYPGQLIKPDMLSTVDASNCINCDPGFIQDPADVVGMIAQKTILPGKLIFPGALKLSSTVMPGQEVTVLFRNGDLQISMLGNPLAEAAAGKPVSVRNLESGKIVSGIVQPDGTVLVNP